MRNEFPYKNNKKACRNGIAHFLIPFFTILIIHFSFLIAGCARMGSPDGGWYDDDPPRVLYATPAEQATNVSNKKITIVFDEYIKLADPT